MPRPKLGNNLGTNIPESGLKPRYRTKNQSKRTNKLALRVLPWAQGVGGSNPLAPTNFSANNDELLSDNSADLTKGALGGANVPSVPRFRPPGFRPQVSQVSPRNCRSLGTHLPATAPAAASAAPAHAQDHADNHQEQKYQRENPPETEQVAHSLALLATGRMPLRKRYRGGLYLFQPPFRPALVKADLRRRIWKRSIQRESGKPDPLLPYSWSAAVNPARRRWSSKLWRKAVRRKRLMRRCGSWLTCRGATA
jgi:hypothetical protein